MSCVGTYTHTHTTHAHTHTRTHAHTLARLHACTFDAKAHAQYIMTHVWVQTARTWYTYRHGIALHYMTTHDKRYTPRAHTLYSRRHARATNTKTRYTQRRITVQAKTLRGSLPTHTDTYMSCRLHTFNRHYRFIGLSCRIDPGPNTHSLLPQGTCSFGDTVPPAVGLTPPPLPLVVFRIHRDKCTFC